VPLKKRRKDVRENPNLVANERFQCLVVLGRLQAWWPLKGKKEASFSFLFISFHFPPNKFYLNIFFIDFKVLMYMVLDH
jgi:hypothetical protein